MNFRRFIETEKEAGDFLEEAGKSLNGEELAKEFGITRTAVKQITQKALTKVFDAVSAIVPDKSPFEVFLILAAEWDLLNDQRGMTDMMRNFSADQKKKIAQDVKAKYPNIDASKFGIK